MKKKIFIITLLSSLLIENCFASIIKTPEKPDLIIDEKSVSYDIPFLNNYPISLFNTDTSISFKLVDEKFNIHISGYYPSDSVLYAALYDKNNNVESIKVINDISEYNVLENDAYYVKAFLWDSDQTPICDSATTYIPEGIVDGYSDKWEADGNMIYSYRGSSYDETVVIPNRINGVPIKTVQNTPKINYALDNKLPNTTCTIFGDCTTVGVKSVVFSPGIKNIGSYVFSGCATIENVSIPDSVVNIAYASFMGNSIKTLNTKNVEHIYDYSFFSCTNLENIDLSSCQYIDYAAFYSCPALKTVTSLNNAILISDYAFYECKLLDGDLILPSESIGTVAFYNCISLDSVKFTGKPKILDFAFSGCTGLSGSLDLSDCTQIGTCAFMNCSGMKGSLTLPSIKKIGNSAFWNTCFTGELNIPEGVEIIHIGAFGRESSYSSSGFSSLKLPSTLKRINSVAFQYQKNISNKIILPEGLEHIGDFAFDHCSSIPNTTLYIPDSVKTIGGDYGIEYDEDIEDTVYNTGYGGHVFYDSFLNTTEYIADSDYFVSENGVLYSADKTRLVAYPAGKTDESFVVPETVIQMDEMSLGKSKIKNLTLNDSFIIGDVPKNIINNTANTLSAALYLSNSLEKIYVNDTNPNYTVKDNMVLSKDEKSLWYSPVNKTAIAVPHGTERIEKGAFFYYNNTLHYNCICIPSTVTYIDESCLLIINGCTSTILIDSNNPVYKVENNDIIRKE